MAVILSVGDSVFSIFFLVDSCLIYTVLRFIHVYVCVRALLHLYEMASPHNAQSAPSLPPHLHEEVMGGVK